MERHSHDLSFSGQIRKFTGPTMPSVPDPQTTTTTTTTTPSPAMIAAKATMGTVTISVIAAMGSFILLGALAVFIHKKRKSKAAIEMQTPQPYGGYRGTSFKLKPSILRMNSFIP